jgi:hypothetical protein
MDNETKLLIFVNEFCNQMAKSARGIRHMHSWYVFADKRPGSVEERFTADAKDYFEYRQMFQV